MTEVEYLIDYNLFSCGFLRTCSEAKLIVRKASSQATTISQAVDNILDAAFQADCGDINHFHAPSYSNVHHYNE
jgi:hypothetical protein